MMVMGKFNNKKYVDADADLKFNNKKYVDVNLKFEQS